MPTVDESELEWTEVEHGEAAFRRKQLGEAAGGEELGCSLYEIPPGKRGWPYHYHHGNEEAVYVLAGEGTMRTPEGEEAIAAGEYVALPAGEDGGHAIHNDGDGVLRFLMVSTMEAPDVTVYPDAEAFGVFTGAAPGDRGDRPFSGFFRGGEGRSLDYWEDVAGEGESPPEGGEPEAGGGSADDDGE